MDKDELLLDAEERMEKALTALERDYGKLRTGRATTSLVEDIKVDYYGTPTPVKQLASVAVPDSRTVTIQPWDRGAFALDMGYTVRCLDNLSTGKYENIEPFTHLDKFTFIKGDIRDLDTCLEATKGVDYVLNQAAWGSVPRSIEMPLLYEEINIRGTLNMMEASRQNGVKKFVYASSSSVYGDHPQLPKKEGVEGKVLSPYALTKQVDEGYGRLYKELYGLDTYGMR